MIRPQDPFGSATSLNAEGTKLAVETFQLLSLLLDPDARRKLQLEGALASVARTAARKVAADLPQQTAV